ncbi:hypothetical protein POG22_03675 [Geitlerinema sp. CS-897]|nr:hypothetical protein [Geitlerinema sp. CS-897]
MGGCGVGVGGLSAVRGGVGGGLGAIEGSARFIWSAAIAFGGAVGYFGLRSTFDFHNI